MRTSHEGVAEIIGHEGVVLSPYRDSVGVWTFGIGHTAKAGPPDPATMARGVARPLEEAIATLRRDLRRFEDRVNEAVKVSLRQHEFDALVSFDFNTGGIFRARLVRLLNAGDRVGAAEAFDGWQRPPVIISRRNAEKALFRDGVYTNGGMATLYTAGADGRVDYRTGTRVNVASLLGGPARLPDDPGDDRQPGAGGAAMPPARVGEVGGVGVVAAIGVFLSNVVWCVGLVVIVAAVGWLLWRFRRPLWNGLKALGASLARLARRPGPRRAGQ